MAPALGLLAAAGPAQAAPRLVSIQTDASCPTAQQLADALHGVLPSVVVVPAVAGAERIVVVEDERGITVEVAGSRRFFAETEQRCSERASQASVFIALMLDPLRLPATKPRGERSEPAGAQPSEATRAGAKPPVVEPAVEKPAVAPTGDSARSSATGGSRTVLAAAPSLQIAPASGLGTTPFALGFAARFRTGRALSLCGGLNFTSTTTLSYPRAEAREKLLALDVGGSWGIWHAGWGLGAELSVVAGPAAVHGENIEQVRSAWGVEWGGRAAFFGEWWPADHLGLFLAESALLWPRPISLHIGGVGEVGHTPSFWLGSQLGLVVRVD